jgi:hypothetical protein
MPWAGSLPLFAAVQWAEPSVAGPVKVVVGTLPSSLFRWWLGSTCQRVIFLTPWPSWNRVRPPLNQSWATRDSIPNRRILELYKCSRARRLLFFHPNFKSNVFISSSGSWNPKLCYLFVDGARCSPHVFLFYIGELAIFFSSFPCLSFGLGCPKSPERWTPTSFHQGWQWHHRVVDSSSDSTAELPPWLATAIQVQINDFD